MTGTTGSLFGQVDWRVVENVTDFVLDHHGSFSGEHGDGLVRTEFNQKMYGPQLWNAFQELKSAFDPDWLLNPGTVVFQDDDSTDMREYLRYGPSYTSLEPRELEKIMLGPDGDDEPSYWWLRTRAHRLERMLFGTHPPTEDRIESLAPLETER